MVRSRKGPAMNDYMITTDNNADLPEDFYKNHEVGCTYLSYTLEGKEYTEGNFLPVEEFYNKACRKYADNITGQSRECQSTF